MQQQHAHGLADDVASADDHALLALHRDLIAVEHLHHACRCTGQKIVFAEHDLADVHGVERVHVLLRIDRRDDRLVVKVLGKRKLYQNAVDVGLVVQRFHQREQLLLCGLGRKRILLGHKADRFAGFLFIVDIHARGRVVADDHHCQSGRDVIGVF